MYLTNATLKMNYIFIALFFFYTFLNCAESRLCGEANCTQKCCVASNVYPLCRTNCEGIICIYDENCDGGFCCVGLGQCVKNSLACRQNMNGSPTQGLLTDSHEKTGNFATWEFALIVLASVIAGILLCFLVVWGCRAIISRI